MPVAPRETVLCRYRYDPLDRLVDCAPCAEVGIQRFYCKSRLATEIQGAVQRSVFQHDDQLLAQLRREDMKVETDLLATDQRRSVLNVLDANRVHPLAYSPYGHRPAENGLLSLLGFNGERPDPVTGHYLLGNGYRAFNPVLMRFNSPDSLSPFGEGGLNAYGYCEGDSINQNDPTGHMLSKLLSTAPLVPPRPTIRTARIFATQVQTPLPERINGTRMARRPSDPSDSLFATERKAGDSTSNQSGRDELMGYHGSTKEHETSLTKGLNPQYVGSRNGIDSGRGFYITPDYESATGWARSSKRAETSTPQVFGVYTKNFNTLKPGRDYTLNTELNTELKDHIQIIIKEPAYPLIYIKAIHEKQKTIRFNSFEAPY
ncbi:RHS repeat-associated core domain-containing protein [Pseudomonas sp. T1.Ur]|uniref:RHS repeat-associated core domain-containing protein n=1 Tax=Pseudomonas sp. T1.Ur TaxID=2928704 RepID=UPI00201DA92C|nr:RHS repeat-associated core domain-containing protein [Pseudomonas sp. T1.Ur]MCL6705201.1 RHS repeat-associated core domain-containing protein [Pseudomonas sp. T1.Ur]